MRIELNQRVAYGASGQRPDGALPAAPALLLSGGYERRTLRVYVNLRLAKAKL